MRWTIMTTAVLTLTTPALSLAATPLCDPAAADCYGLQTNTSVASGSAGMSKAENDGPTNLAAAASIDPAGLGFASASASADLSTGAIRLQVSDTLGSANAQASWFERVSFILPSGMSSVDIPVTWRVNGSNQFQSETASTFTSRAVSGTFMFRPAFDNSLDAVNFTLTNCQFSLCDDGAQSAQFSDIITIKPGVLYELAMNMSISGQYVIMDFSHTAFLNWQLPPGVTVNSSSGVFLASPLSEAVAPGVPEPQGWALLISGFGIVGGALRHRRRTMRDTSALLAV